jgi:acyl-coenzyme A thioesterase PaaI-like protein
MGMSVGGDKVPIAKLEGFDCFACGTNNPIGLKMSFYRQGDAVCSDLVLSPNHVGWQNIAHGGIISTLLDEVMSWTVLYFKKSFAVTRRMEVRYLRPVPVGVALTVRGKITADHKRQICRAGASLLDDQGKILARGEGEFALLDEKKLSVFPEDLKEKMLQLFESFS